MTRHLHSVALDAWLRALLRRPPSLAYARAERQVDLLAAVVEDLARRRTVALATAGSTAGLLLDQLLPLPPRPPRWTADFAGLPERVVLHAPDGTVLDGLAVLGRRRGQAMVHATVRPAPMPATGVWTVTPADDSAPVRVRVDDAGSTAAAGRTRTRLVGGDGDRRHALETLDPRRLAAGGNRARGVLGLVAVTAALAPWRPTGPVSCRRIGQLVHAAWPPDEPTPWPTACLARREAWAYARELEALLDPTADSGRTPEQRVWAAVLRAALDVATEHDDLLELPSLPVPPIRTVTCELLRRPRAGLLRVHAGFRDHEVRLVADLPPTDLAPLLRDVVLTLARHDDRLPAAIGHEPGDWALLGDDQGPRLVYLSPAATRRLMDGATLDLQGPGPDRHARIGRDWALVRLPGGVRLIGRPPSAATLCAALDGAHRLLSAPAACLPLLRALGLQADELVPETVTGGPADMLAAAACGQPRPPRATACWHTPVGTFHVYETGCRVQRIRRLSPARDDGTLTAHRCAAGAAAGAAARCDSGRRRTP